MKKTLILALAAVLLVSCVNTANDVSENDISSEPVEPMPIEIEGDLYSGPQFQADLDDVTGGEALGTAIASLNDTFGTYTVVASFVELPELEEGYFYEGWLVRTDGELSVISTGVVENDMNFYTSDLDLTDHTKYILTLEPDDGDPAPADHILDGSFYQTY